MGSGNVARVVALNNQWSEMGDAAAMCSNRWELKRFSRRTPGVH